MKKFVETKTIKIAKGTVEQDINLVFPSGQEIQLQYRNYGEGESDASGDTLDVILPKPTEVYNWQGSEMKPAKNIRGRKEAHKADQLCIIL